MEKRSDDKGYERGAKGIDGKEGESFHTEGVDKAAWSKMYGRNWVVESLKKA